MAQDDFDTAIQLYFDAANKGYAPANYKIANLYYSEDDNGLPFDVPKAKEYYKKAAAGGVKNAGMILKFME